MDMNYEISFNDIYYTSALIEYIGRKTLNRRSVIAAAIGLEGIERLLKLACVNHCLSFQQVADEVIERYHIYKGNYDTVSNCKYNVPSFLPIGKVYARLAQDVHENGTITQQLCTRSSSPVSMKRSPILTRPSTLHLAVKLHTIIKQIICTTMHKIKLYKIQSYKCSPDHSFQFRP